MDIPPSELPPENEPLTHLLRYGLARAIQVHSESFRLRDPGLAVDLDLVDDEQFLSETAARTLFRVYQEAMHNIANHAGEGHPACTVRVRYYPSGAAMVLEISDNGDAFSIPADWAKFSASRAGVMGMKERIEALGGSLNITAEPGQKTVIQASLPLERG